MRLKKYFLIILILSLIVSCSEELGTGTLRLNLHCNVPKTIVSGNSSMDIVKFTINGNGPGGKTFTVDTTSSSVSLEGIVLGNWKISALGYNSAGKEIARGETEFILEESSSVRNVELSVLTGDGSCSIKFDWDSDVKDPNLKISLFEINDTDPVYEKNINVGSGRTNYTFSLSGLPAGTYLMKALLFNSSVKITGTCQALRITRADKTTANISFCSDSTLSNEIKSLYTVSETSPITGHLETSFGEQADAGKELGVTLVIDSYYETTDSFKIKWYLDGNEISEEKELQINENSLSFSSESGVHFLDAVVYEKKQNTVGSATYKFISKIYAKKGCAVLNRSIKPDSVDGLFFAEDSMISPLSNGRFLLLTPSENSLQIISVYNNSISVHNTYTGQDIGFNWLSCADGLYSRSDMKMFAITDNKTNITLFSFKDGSDTIEIAHFDEEPLRIEGEYKPLNMKFSDINAVYLVPTSNGGGTIIICNKGSLYCVSLINDGFYVNRRGVMLLCSQNTVAFDGCGNCCVSLDNLGNSLYSVRFSGGEFTSLWSLASTKQTGLKSVRFLNKENLVAASDNKLTKFSKYSDSWMEYQSVEINSSVFEVSNDGLFIYNMDFDGLLTTFSVKTGRMIRQGQTDCKKPIKQMVLNENDMLALDSEGNLMILTIAQEDIE